MKRLINFIRFDDRMILIVFGLLAIVICVQIGYIIDIYAENIKIDLEIEMIKSEIKSLE